MAMTEKARAEFLATRKPHHAAKHVPDGHTEMKTCPMCKGKGKVKADSDLTSRMLKRV